VKDHIAKYCPSVAFVETKVSLANVSRLTSCAYQDWHSSHNFAIGDAGRIWVAWNPRVWNCIVISMSYQQIIMSITNNGGLHGFLTIVYGESVLARRDPLWRDLHQISGQVHSSPWLVSGDFNNTARYTSEKVGGKVLSFGQLAPFNDCLNLCRLIRLEEQR